MIGVGDPHSTPVPPARLGRRRPSWRRASPTHVAPDRPVVTFTFDDFPKSALTGANLVEAAGGRAGFYAATALSGGRDPLLGEMFDSATLAELAARGHEIGAHTHTHLDCAATPIAQLEKDVAANLIALADAGCREAIATFAYPHGASTLMARRWAADVFAAARGGRPGVNRGEVDRAYLWAVELGPSGASRRRALRMLETCIRSNGWLIFFTHDVSLTPSDGGSPPALIAELCARARDGGAVLAAPSLGAALSGVIN